MAVERSNAGFRKLPDGVRLGPLSQQVFDILAEHTSFPWAVMQAQSRRVGAQAEGLTKQDLSELVPHLATAVGRFTSPERQAQVERELRQLL